ncbi:nucleoprotein [Boteke virus]|uniref:Nucleoprotein n=1 Tax=Boteke virus TaxID=864698 RepID=A0AAE8XEI3_9RHAB|nr:nucleoprotein [Boteke virus]UAU42839.1 nucleoprotein [Boteke virus]
MSQSKITNRITGKKICVPLIADKDKPEYPSDALKNKKAIKLYIPKFESTFEALAKAIKAGIKNQDLSCDGAKVYLFEFYERITETCEENWVSFGRMIGEKDKDVSPFSPVDVIRKGEYKSTASEPTTENDYEWLAIYLLIQYRIVRAANQEYKTKIAAAGDRVLKSLCNDAYQIEVSWGTTEQWINDLNYCKIIACIDMFFYKFKKNDHAICRIATITSRYRDGAALLSLNHLRNLCNGDLSLGLMWIFNPSVALELEQIAREGQEIDNNFSLTPYIIDLQICRLSPYSTTHNPGLHLFIHAAGTFMLKRRSIDARILDCPGETSIIQNAGVLSFVLYSKMDWKLIYGDENEQIGDTIQAPIASSSKTSDDHPGGRSPSDWFKWMKKREFKLPSTITNFMKSQADKITNPRPETIGSRIKLLYGSQ